MEPAPSFEEFWPRYLREHSHPVNRRLHFLGTFLGHLILVLVVLERAWLWIWLAPAVGYLFAWVGHFFIEKNKPATFTHPVWSLRGDLRMFYYTLLGKKLT